MKLLFLCDFIKRIIGYKLSRLGLIKATYPMILTFSVTNMCQSRCKTCYLWQLYRHKPELKQKELDINEIEKIFKSLGPIYFFNVSGGEPYLRKDLDKIIDLACKYLKPKVIHIPTNGILPKIIEEKTRECLEVIKKNHLCIPLTIKPSLDGVGKKHDEIRGIKGNFDKVLDTIKRLKTLQQEYKNLHVGVGTVISKFNIKDLKKISDYANNLDVDSYISEIAEQRSELFNTNKEITPCTEDYERAINYFSQNIKKGIKNKNFLTRCVQAFRLVYYDYVIRILKEKKKMISCYAGLTSFHLTPYGDIWPCCILGYKVKMGNLREVNYDFKRMWHSKKAQLIRQQTKNCYCPLAIQAYSNLLLNYRAVFKIIWNLLRF